MNEQTKENERRVSSSELDRRQAEEWDRLFAEDDGYREWCETIEKQLEQWEDR